MHKKKNHHETAILLAEDNEHTWQPFKKVLVDLGYNVTIVENGRGVLAALDEQKFDLILMDMHLADLDGFETTQIIRQNPVFDSVPIIALTAYTSEGERCRRVGCDDFISKPIERQRLVERVRFHLEQARRKRARAKYAFAEANDEIQMEIEKLKNFFIENLKERYAQISAALQVHNFQEIALVGHTLKGSGTSYGFPEISDLGSQIEIAAKHHRLSKLQSLVLEMERYLKSYETAASCDDRHFSGFDR